MVDRADKRDSVLVLNTQNLFDGGTTISYT